MAQNPPKWAQVVAPRLPAIIGSAAARQLRLIGPVLTLSQTIINTARPPLLQDIESGTNRLPSMAQAAYDNARAQLQVLMQSKLRCLVYPWLSGNAANQDEIHRLRLDLIRAQGQRRAVKLKCLRPEELIGDLKMIRAHYREANDGKRAPSFDDWIKDPHTTCADLLKYRGTGSRQGFALRVIHDLLVFDRIDLAGGSPPKTYQEYFDGLCAQSRQWKRSAENKPGSLPFSNADELEAMAPEMLSALWLLRWELRRTAPSLYTILEGRSSAD